jgi:hypothetical protein
MVSLMEWCKKKRDCFRQGKQNNNHLLLIVLLGTCFFPISALSQAINTFNFNIDNGLPSNYIYGVFKDRHGYLWVTTQKGVARYNGYEFKIFNQSNGISNEDIWELCEDKKGRIWLSNISDELGYIYNGKYYKISAQGINHTVYPRDIRAWRDGIIFWSTYITGDGRSSICIENNDTLHKYDIINLFADKSSKDSRSVNVIIDEFGQPIIVYDNAEIYKVTFQNGKPVAEFVLKFKDVQTAQISDPFYGLLKNYIVAYSVVIKSNKFFATNLSNNKIQEIDLSKLSIHENINYIFFDYRGDKHLYVITNKNIVEFGIDNDSVKFIGAFSSKVLLGNPEIDADKIGSYHVDDFWGNCIGTTTNGLLLNYSTKNYFKKVDVNLDNFSYIGGLKDSISFWWSDIKNSMAKVEDKIKAQYYTYENLKKVFSVIPYHADSFIVYGVHGYLFNNRSGKLVENDAYGGNVRSAIVDSSGDYYVVTSRGFGKISGDAKHTFIYYDHDRYQGLVYDSLRGNYWAYNFDRVFVHGKNADTLVKKEGVSCFGVRKIEKIAVDNKYGNIFFKGGDNITVYDVSKNSYRELFNNFNLKESSLLIDNGILIVSGSFGVLFSKILGGNNISKPLFYPNVKNKNFNFIYDVVVLGKQLVLNTDKGTYSVNIPGDNDIINAETDSTLYRYKFVLSNGDTVRNFISGDTISINQKDQRLQFDIINPFGNGHVKYTYKLSGDTTWHELNANELTLPSFLKPDSYYELGLKVYDNVWKSNAAFIHIYIRPFWYQTVSGRRIISTAIVSLVLLCVSIIVLITRRAVLRGAQRRNLRMELELKSLYAQLNPHFVFNTLNSALSMIKKEKLEDASLHISKFARLLRSYLDSSRNRFVTLSDEIMNITNYVEIQQTRFPKVFTYEIVVSDKIVHPGKIIIPSLLLQPIVENAISHGLVPNEENGRLKIEFENEQENEIICTVEDNGIGREKSRVLNKRNDPGKESHGANLVNELIAIINKYEKFRIEIMYVDKQKPLTGTIVRLRIKNESYGKV